MDVLVTGGSGMIGGYVVRELLAHHHRVTVFSRSPQALEGVSLFAGDVLDLAQLKAACRGKDAIVHLAAVPNLRRSPPEEVLQVNVMGTVHVLESAVQEGVGQVVLASSNAATGYWRRHHIPPDYLPMDEEHPCRPRDAYALSKCLNEQTCRSYTAAHGLRTICLRIAGGKYLDRPGASLVVPSEDWGAATVEELWGKFLAALDRPAAGVWSFWVYVDARDVAAAVRLALENEVVEHGTYFLSAEDSFSRFESSTLLERFFPEVPVRGNVSGYATLVSYGKAARELGFAPRYSWRDCAYLQNTREHGG